MKQPTLKGHPVELAGVFPALHTQAHPFTLVGPDLEHKSLSDFKNKRKLIATVPSLDTGVCSAEAKHLNNFAKHHPHHIILIVSADLPFAQKRFCSVEHLENVHTLSMMRNKEFGRDYGVLIHTGPLSGLLTRAILILDEKDRIIYTEMVPEISHEPDYHKALAALQ
jgi:thiol peroxidase